MGKGAASKAGGGGGGGGKGKSTGSGGLNAEQQALKRDIGARLDEMSPSQRAETLSTLKSTLSSEIEKMNRQVEAIDKSLTREAKRRMPAGEIVQKQDEREYLVTKIQEIKNNLSVLNTFA